MTAVAVFFNRFQMGLCYVVLRASKIIDFLLQFILQQTLLSLLTITVGGHWISEVGGKLMVTSVHCCSALSSAQYGD